MKLQVGVKVLLQRNDTYLFLRRNKDFKAGTPEWDIPGGRIESSEALGDALAREVREETALELESVDTLLAAQDIFVPNKDLHVVRLTYRATAHGEIALSDEHEEFKWMTQREVLAESHVDVYLRKVLEGEL